MSLCHIGSWDLLLPQQRFPWNFSLLFGERKSFIFNNGNCTIVFSLEPINFIMIERMNDWLNSGKTQENKVAENMLYIIRDDYPSDTLHIIREAQFSLHLFKVLFLFLFYFYFIFFFIFGKFNWNMHNCALEVADVLMEDFPFWCRPTKFSVRCWRIQNLLKCRMAPFIFQQCKTLSKVFYIRGQKDETQSNWREVKCVRYRHRENRMYRSREKKITWEMTKNVFIHVVNVYVWNVAEHAVSKFKLPFDLWCVVQKKPQRENLSFCFSTNFSLSIVSFSEVPSTWKVAMILNKRATTNAILNCLYFHWIHKIQS